MKAWGMGRWGVLLAVLLLLVSGAVLPLGAQAQGTRIFGEVHDCGNFDPVGATVILVDAHAQFSNRTYVTDPDDGFFDFPDPNPGYYSLVVQPTDFTHFRVEDGPFRFDGTAIVRKPLCADKMPDDDRLLNLTVVDAAPQSASESVTFQEFLRGPENVTDPTDRDYDPLSFYVALDTRPLAWESETLWWNDSDTLLGGERLVRNVDYRYTPQEAYAGTIYILNATVQTRLENTVRPAPDKGWLEIRYSNASESSKLAHPQVANAGFTKNGSPLLPPTLWSTLTLNNDTGELKIVASDWRFGARGDTLRATYAWSGVIEGAKVTPRFPARDQEIAGPLFTDRNGKATVGVWQGGTFNVTVEAATYQPAVWTFGPITQNVTQVIPLQKGWTVRVQVTAAEDGQPLSADGLTGALISNDATVNRSIRVLAPRVTNNQILFYAYDGAWTLVTDANGRTANVTTVTVSGGNVPPIQVALSMSPEELLVTEVAFKGRTDWGNLTVWRNLTLLPDSVFPGVGFESLRNLRWQLDLRFGNGNGAFDSAERDAFAAYLLSAGPFYTVTDDFFTVNGETYISVDGSYSVQVNDPGAGQNLTVVAWADFKLSGTAKSIPAEKPKYYVNVTTFADASTPSYGNQSVLVRLPRTYEMTSRSTTGNVTTRNFVNVTVDPGVDTVNRNPRVNMIVEHSLTGVARAEVEGPAGNVSVREADQDEYLAWVRNDTGIVFSANKTTDRQNVAINAKDANFTWLFRKDNNTAIPPAGIVYGIWTTFTFPSEGDYTVQLNVTQVNPDNRTYRWINITVDNVDPTAAFKTNKTGSTVNPTELTVNEDQFITFNGGDSTDILWTNATLSPEGKIAEWRWDFDGDGIVDRTGQITSWNYSKPGLYSMNLTVLDFVGHKSANRTLNVTVNDVTAPQINFVVLDPTNEWREVTTLTEGRLYFFNASKTTDNSLNETGDNVNLTYRWRWGDGSLNGTESGTRGELNVTHSWAMWGDYKLEITVWDASNKNTTLTRSPFTIQANTSAHPNVQIRSTPTLTTSPTSPEEGAELTFTFNITNLKGSADATNLKAMIAIRERNQDSNQTGFTVTYLFNGAVVTTPVLEPDENLTVKIVWHAPNKVGNHSLRITVWDGDEPQPWIDGGNRQDTSLLVKEAGWKFWAIVGAFLFVIFGLPIIYYVVRKVRAGEWQLRRKREEGEDEDEEEEEEDEEEEEEERGGKKRL